MDAPLTPKQSKLAADNFGLVFHIARRYTRNRPWLMDEAIGVATDSLLVAVRSWDPAGGTHLASWISRRIRYDLIDFRSGQRTFQPVFPESRVSQPDRSMEMRELYELALASMDPRERMVMLMRADGLTLLEVGDLIGLTTERARQIEKSAKEKAIAGLAAKQSI